MPGRLPYQSLLSAGPPPPRDPGSGRCMYSSASCGLKSAEEFRKLRIWGLAMRNAAFSRGATALPWLP